MDQWFHADDGAVLDAFKETFLAFNPQYTDVQFFDAARGGSALLSGSASQYAVVRAPDDPELFNRISQNYWYDEGTGDAGPNLALFSDRLKSAVNSGVEFLGIIWAQGEADTTYVGANGAGDYTTGLQFVLDQLMQASDAPHVYIQALGDRAFYSEPLHGGSAAIREAQQSIADASDTITLATTIFDLELRDSTHLTVEGYQTAANRMAIAMSTGEISPAIGEAILVDATTILIQIDLVPDQRFAGEFSLGGFSISENGVEFEITSASITPTGLMRFETLAELSNPIISYGAVEHSVTMVPDDFVYVTGPVATVPILPFSVTVSQPRLETTEIPGGLRIESGALSDLVIGLSGDDELYGNGGHDILVGGWGQDGLYGGEGSDTFVLGEDTSPDIVYDFSVTDDAIGLRGFSQSEVSFLAYGDNSLDIRTSGGQQMILRNVNIELANDIRFHMLGTDGSNELQGSAGDDRIFAHGGDDTINSGAGYDRITVGAGSDTVIFGVGFDTNIVYDFDVDLDVISLVGTPVNALAVSQYKDTDLELRTSEGDRLVLRDVSLSDFALMTVIDSQPEVGLLSGTEGNDILQGTGISELFDSLGGTDRLYGGGGSDVFVFGAGSDLNVIYDFVDGQDRILIDGGDFDALTIIPYKGTDAEVRLDTGDRLVLRNIDFSAVDADNFVFSIPEEFM